MLTFVVVDVEVEDHGLVVVHGRVEAVPEERLSSGGIFLWKEKSVSHLLSAK